MTELDLRLKYKSETGEYPTYGRCKREFNPKLNSTIGNYKGGLTHEYTEWLEEYRGPNPTSMSMTWQRDYFLKETGLHATYYDKYRNLRYSSEYKLWMERLLCNTLTVLT
jgi:hypothetical protein